MAWPKELRRVQNPRNKKGAILQREIEIAMKNTRSNAEASRFLGVSVQTYKKYAIRYSDEAGVNLYEKHMNKAGRGIKDRKKDRDTRYPLQEILDGKYPNYPDSRLKDRLVRDGYLPECCSNCGFSEPRVTDGKLPLLLNYKDSDRDNKILDNVYLLCYNCHFTLVGALNFKGWHRNVFYDSRTTKFQPYKPEKS
tara:strand:- start:9957 stop:10541 length:585 start_codon:yes stop_codon:yes gene_type:complete